MTCFEYFDLLPPITKAPPYDHPYLTFVSRKINIIKFSNTFSSLLPKIIANTPNIVWAYDCRLGKHTSVPDKVTRQTRSQPVSPI